MSKKWIQEAIGKEGALHKALKVPGSKKIPSFKLKVHETDTPLMKKRKTRAKALRGFD